MESEIEQLVSMGFSTDSASKALAANDGDLQKATDWLLNPNPNNNVSQPETSTPPSSQSKINRFFQFPTKKTQQEPQQPEKSPPPSSLPQYKRQKISQNQPDSSHAPLSERMRPRVLEEVVGQDHLLGEDSLLRSAVKSGRLPSIILWGPPGTGKTSIAKAIVATSCEQSLSIYRFVSLSAVTCGVKEVREAVETAKKIKSMSKKRTVLFLDEVHRFNKSQQDSFLPVIEDGSIVFIGATTENPSFHLVTPLLSRCRVLTLNPLQPHHLVTLVNRALSDKERGLSVGIEKTVEFEVNDEAINFLSLHCDGDARVALNVLEISATTAIARVKNPVLITLNDVKEALQCKHLAYDRKGEEHYNLISALIKSMRGSDPDAAIYWLVRMMEGGEEPLYIARRLVVFASEDVGLADPQAITQAVACYQACHFIGMPECKLNLAQCVLYMALARKSVAVYKAMGAAMNVVKESIGQNESVPLHLRNAPTKLMKDLGYGKEYLYPPDNPGSNQSYLPSSLQGYKFLHWP